MQALGKGRRVEREVSKELRHVPWWRRLASLKQDPLGGPAQAHFLNILLVGDLDNP